MRNQTCCFTGHRFIPHAQIEALRCNLTNLIQELYQENICTFISGGALGFDLLAAETVIALKKQGVALTLILALPCKEQTRFWSVSDSDRYSRILEQADEVGYLFEEYTKDCMLKRNRKMVECACCCITYLCREQGGTFSTVNYAKKLGLEIYNLADK